MYLLGLTGGIASGETTIANMFEEEHVAVFDADTAVRAIIADDLEAQQLLINKFNTIEPSILSDIVFSDINKLYQLEAILHPPVYRLMHQFLDAQQAAGAILCVIDIPLLYEVGWDKECDAVIYLQISQTIQRERALQRSRMTESKLQSIITRQQNFLNQKLHSRYVINTDRHLEELRKDVRLIVKEYINA